MKKISLILILTFISIKSFAGSCPDGSEPIKSISDDGTYFVYKCGGGDGNTKESNSASKVSSNNSASSTQNSKIEIYDVEFSPGILDELLNLVISKTEYDFSAHRLSRNNDNFICRFSLKRIVYENNPKGEVENWNMLTGKVHINGSDVSLSGSWRMGGLSSDPSYLEDEVNLKLTENGHLVGKMAYFLLTVNDGEVPMNPLYVVLNEHKSSTPINPTLKNTSFEQFIDVEDWAGGVLFVSGCRDGNVQAKKTKPVKKEVKKVAVKEEPAVTKTKVTSSTQALTSESDPVVSKVIEVTHGDKLVVNIAEPHKLADDYVKVSLKDVDAPDATKSCPKQMEFGLKVKDYVTKRLSEASSINLTNIRKTNTKLIAQVIVDGVDLGEELVEMGYASEEYGYWKPYYCSALTAVQAGQQLFDKDPDMSIFWLERSLLLDPNGSNNTLSTYLLSQHYENRGEENISVDYLKKSASLGWVQAMEELGQQLLIGNRVKQDKIQGKKWLKKAHDKGSQIAETIYCNSLPVAKQNTCKL